MHLLWFLLTYHILFGGVPVPHVMPCTLQVTTDQVTSLDMRATCVCLAILARLTTAASRTAHTLCRTHNATKSQVHLGHGPPQSPDIAVFDLERGWPVRRFRPKSPSTFSFYMYPLTYNRVLGAISRWGPNSEEGAVSGCCRVAGKSRCWGDCHQPLGILGLLLVHHLVAMGVRKSHVAPMRPC